MPDPERIPTAALDAAEAEMTARSEALMAPEIWRVRGQWHARQGRRPAAIAAFGEARRRAEAQGAGLLELRALLDLAELAGSPGGDPGDLEAALTELGSVHGRFSQGHDHFELRRAADLLRRQMHPAG